jgi:hypothetical protein
MTPGEQLQEYERVYVAHWEIARFEVAVGRSFLGRQGHATGLRHPHVTSGVAERVSTASTAAEAAPSLSFCCPRCSKSVS